jgi:UTP--glucose-1-phosphate uridylyltransferase
MFPVVDKPIIQYVVKELVEAGIEQITFVTSSRKKAVEDYFDTDFELEQRLDFA